MAGDYFELKARGTTVKTEVIAGITTFLTMAYIIFVNPDMLSKTGMDKTALVAVVCLVSAISTIVTGVFGKAPIAMAPGMGLNAFFTYTLVLSNKMSWETALGAVFVSGVLFLLLTLIGLRKKLVEAIPPPAPSPSPGRWQRARRGPTRCRSPCAAGRTTPGPWLRS